MTKDQWTVAGLMLLVLFAEAAIHPGAKTFIQSITATVKAAIASLGVQPMQTNTSSSSNTSSDYTASDSKYVKPVKGPY